MNPIDELRAARPAHLGDTPVDERTRAAELSYAMSRPRSARQKRRTVRPVWGFSLVGAAAAATAVAVVVSGTGGTTPRAPDAAPATVASSTPKVRLSARDILLTAAAKAARQPAGTGAYWHTATVQRTLYAVEGADYLVMDRQRNERWTPSATRGDLWSSTKPLGARPATAADEEAWKQAGSPAEIPVKPRPMTLSTSPRKMSTGHSPLTDGDKVFWLGRNVTTKDLRGLPSDPAKLKAWLLRSYERNSTESSSDPTPADTWLFSVSAGLITDMPVTPQVRGAAFRMLAALDAVDVIENVTDAEGRQGTAVAIEERTKGSGVMENRLIFDQATGRGLAYENVVVKPAGLQSTFEPGTVWYSQAVLEAGWTDSKPSF
ncbi:CU044_5270 family protein [Nonomuraea sp. NEAU-A123]|uniref:CU044_5270 family protein n=1 Tax=Nonomuraea sp. NEAU-A123 TaxID=2839649 RepID=UPI001BE45F22|nr:CU044_5270 family protein [Nonomuraea sp. NEAU-A123]MBT2234654.1 CU044_5270 family protein [Nonomuraea sp. NEAU-A123]